MSDSNREKVLYCVEYLAEKVWFFSGEKITGRTHSLDCCVVVRSCRRLNTHS